MKKLVLINPHPIGNVGEENVSVLNQMPVNLGYLKVLTPKHWQVDIIDETQELAIDENTGDITFGEADLVGITSVSYQAHRAYQIATACRKRGYTGDYRRYSRNELSGGGRKVRGLRCDQRSRNDLGKDY